MKLRILPKSNSILPLTILCLVVFGIAMVFDASVVDASKTFNDKFYYVKKQLLWGALGTVSFIVCSNIKYHYWQKIAVPFLGVTIFLLLLVLIPGVGVSALGASRRIHLWGIGLQPAELAKLSLSVYLAASLSRKINLVRFIVPLAVVCSLILMEPDMGTTIIVSGIAFIIYFASGAPVVHFVGAVMFALISSVVLALSSPYRRERILTFLNPGSDVMNTSYHIRQILIALGSGGFWGLGLGQSRQKHLFLPEPATDSIFAVIGEELGLIGALAVIVALFYLVLVGLKIAKIAPDNFGKLLGTAITSWFGIQISINLMAMVSLVPLTGVPLPFISYGGSSLVVSMAAAGILLNIASHPGIIKNQWHKTKTRKKQF